MNDKTEHLTERNRLWAKRSAVHYLGQYSTSTKNLYDTMLRRAKRKFNDITPEDAEELANSAVLFCTENGLVNDASYAETKTSAGQRKGHSKRRIQSELEMKGVAAETIQNAVENVDDFYSALQFAKRKRLGPWRIKELDEKLQRKEIGAFARNMLSGNIAYRILNMDIDEAEELIYEGPTP